MGVVWHRPRRVFFASSLSPAPSSDPAATCDSVC